jgi:cytochrome P450
MPNSALERLRCSGLSIATEDGPPVCVVTEDEWAADPHACLERIDACGPLIAAKLGTLGNVVYVGPALMPEFSGLERSGIAQVFNPPDLHRLFASALFNLTGADYSSTRRAVSSAFSRRNVEADRSAIAGICARSIDAWPDEVESVAESMVIATTDVFSWYMLGVTPGSSLDGELRKAITTFIGAAHGKPTGLSEHDLDTTRRNLVSAINSALVGNVCKPITELLRAYAERSDLGSDAADQLLAIAIASIETTASLAVWLSITMWQHRAMLLAPASDLHAALAYTEANHSPNLLVVRRLVAHGSIGGEVLSKGTIVVYSPAASTFRSQRGVRPTLFGAGTHACPGKFMAEAAALDLAERVVESFAPRVALDRLGANHLPAKFPSLPVPARRRAMSGVV